MLGRVRILLWALVGVAAIAGLLIALRPPATQPAVSGGSVASIGGPFTLTGADGKAFSSARLAGKPFAIFFGFTHCPDVCPTTLARLATLRGALGKGDEAFAILFVTVDPERDTPAELSRYAGLFGTPMIALTGSPATIAQVKKQFGVYSAKVVQPGGDYGVDHTATVFLMDKAGRFAATIAPDEQDSVALAKLRRVTG
jgi:protein SCO1/2